MLQLHSNDLTSVNDVHQIIPSMVLNDELKLVCNIYSSKWHYYSIQQYIGTTNITVVALISL